MRTLSPAISRFAPVLGVLLVPVLLSACSGGSGDEQVAQPPPKLPPIEHKHAEPADTIGYVNFQVACEKGAEAPFNRALGMMHHMMYDEARESFRAVSAAHPKCPMAYWGEAATILRPLWPGRPDSKEMKTGWDLTQKARSLAPGSERDRLLLAAMEEFFREPETADWWTRIRRWADSLAQAREAHPKDIDIAAFYALSRLALAYVADDRKPLHAEAGAILMEIWNEYPTHPGAVHYTIHANDAEGRAGESPDIVASYGKIAPGVPHALHMPTHIYVRLGEWPGVVEWNSASADAALKFPIGDQVSMHYIHAVDYKVYAQLQQGDDAAARATFDQALAAGKHQTGFAGAFHLAAMPGRLALERRDWTAAAAIPPRVPADQPWDKLAWPEGLSWFARGVGAARLKNLDGATEAEQQLIALRDKAKAAGEAGFATFLEVDRLMLSGWIAAAKGEADAALKLMRAAADLEGTVDKHPVTPGAVYPPYEALGDLLAELGRHAEALKAYDAAEARWPQRYNTLLGAARAAKAAERPTTALRHYKALLTVAGKSKRAGVTEAKQFVDAAEKA